MVISMTQQKEYDRCKGCDLSSSDCWKDRPRCPYDIDRCSGCGAGIVISDLPDDLVILERQGMTEYWGAPTPLPDAVIGFICPICGAENKF